MKLESGLTLCHEDSEEYSLFCSKKKELMKLCNDYFTCFDIIGYTKQVQGCIITYNVKILVDDDAEVDDI